MREGGSGCCLVVTAADQESLETESAVPGKQRVGQEVGVCERENS